MPKKIKPNHLKKLLKAWTAAAPEERRAFLDLVAAESRASGLETATGRRPTQVGEETIPEAAAVETGEDPEVLIANGRYLLPSTIARIETVMRTRRMTPSAIMGELGFSSRDPSLARALAMKAALRLSVVKALERFLLENEPGSQPPSPPVGSDGS